MYQIQVNAETLEYSILKDGHLLPFTEYQNIQWAIQSMMAVINRTESEVRRQLEGDRPLPYENNKKPSPK